MRSRQTDCRYEPPFPGLDTVVVAMSAPNMCIHFASSRCAEEMPHLIAACGEFKEDERRLPANDKASTPTTSPDGEHIAQNIAQEEK